jgi:hypothetical protein
MRDEDDRINGIEAEGVDADRLPRDMKFVYLPPAEHPFSKMY